MNEVLVREFAAAIVNEQILSNWRFYAIMGAVSLVAAVIAAFVSTYIRKRAETYATRADLAELVQQLQVTTKAAEEVKSAISHADWRQREWSSIRRVKLEELMTTVYALRGWVDEDMKAHVFETPRTLAKEPRWQLEVVSLLYFPELRQEVDALVIEAIRHSAWSVGIGRQLAKAGSDADARTAAYARLDEEYPAYRKKLLGMIYSIEKRIPGLIQEIAGA